MQSVITVTSRFEDAADCLSDSCLNDGVCFDLAGDFICRCNMEYYGKRCQHTKYHTPPKLEIPLVSVSTQTIRIKWVQPDEDPSIGTVLESILMTKKCPKEEIVEFISPDLSEIRVDVEPSTNYTFKFQVIYKNGLRSVTQDRVKIFCFTNTLIFEKI